MLFYLENLLVSKNNLFHQLTPQLISPIELVLIMEVESDVILPVIKEPFSKALMGLESVVNSLELKNNSNPPNLQLQKRKTFEN